MVNKNDFRDLVLEAAYELTGVHYLKKDGAMMIDALIMAIEKVLVSGDSVDLRGLGKFKVVNIPERTIKALNGEYYTVPEHKAPRFTAAAKLKRDVAQGILREE